MRMKKEFCIPEEHFKCTSSHRSGEVVYNALIRLQEEDRLRARPSAQTATEKVISKQAEIAGTGHDTVITKAMMQHPQHWQALLEKLSDFLVCSPGVWWQRLQSGDIEVFDSLNNTHPEEPLLHHFRSSSLKEEHYLTEKWETCLNEKIPLPAEDILHYDPIVNLPEIVNQAKNEDPSTQVLEFTEVENDPFEESNENIDPLPATPIPPKM